MTGRVPIWAASETQRSPHAQRMKRLRKGLRFWLSSCRTSLAVSALRIMRYCLYFFCLLKVGKPFETK